MNPYNLKSLIAMYLLNIAFIMYVLLGSNNELSDSIRALLTIVLIFPAMVIVFYYKSIMRE